MQPLIKLTRLIKLSLLAVVLAQASAPVLAADTTALTAVQILEASDRIRGGGLSGVQWDLKITATDNDTGENVRQLRVRADGDNSLAETTFPPRAAGGKLLQLSRNMWYGRPDIQKAVSISSRQKMMGPAANGDIASTNYVKDYDATILREDSFNNEAVVVLNLIGKNKWVTYDRIVYWVSRARLLPVKAEFYTVSGKLFKTAVFENNNTLVVDGKKQPFVSKMVIKDEVVNSNVSVLEYSGVRLQTFSRDDFSVNSLTR